MKLRSQIFLFTLLAVGIFSCNTAETPPPPPAPKFLISGTTVDPNTGQESAWSTNTVTADLNSDGLFVKAVNGNDTLFIAVPSIQEGEYIIEQESDLGAFNYYETVTNGNRTLYTFKADGSGGGLLTITDQDSASQEISGELTLNYFNPINNSDFFSLTNARLNNIPYTVQAPPTGGGPDFGTGTISFTADGQDYNFAEAIGQDTLGTISLSGSTPPTGIPSINISLADNIEPGNYSIDGSNEIIISLTLSQTGIYLSEAGTLEILSHDTVNELITANFSFTASNVFNEETIEVTGGSFDMEY